MILTEKEKKLIDKFYQISNFGFDSKNVIIEKITETQIFYSFCGYKYIFDGTTTTEQQNEKSITADEQTADKTAGAEKTKLLTNKQLTKKILQIIPFWEQDENSYNDTLKMLESNDIKQIKHIMDFLQDYETPKIIEQLQIKIDKLQEQKKWLLKK